MRGKASAKIYEQAKTRITPAYAGKSFMTERLYMHIGDHPRLCGEKFS